MCSLAGSTNVKMLLLHKLFSCHLGIFCAESAVKYHIFCNGLSLGSVRNTNIFYRRQNPTAGTTSQFFTRLLTENCNFGSL